MSSTTLSCLRRPHHSWIHNDNCPPFSRVPETSNKNPQPPPDSWFSGNLSPYLLNLSKVSDLSSLYLLKLSPPSVSLAPPSPIFFPLFCPLLDLSPCLLKLPVPSTAMDPTTLCFTVCHHTHPPWRVHPICGLHRHPHPDTSQIHGSSPESTLEPPWTPLEHSTLSSREPKPILVSTPIPENQTYNNKTHSWPVFPISIKSTTTHTLALPEIWKNFSTPSSPLLSTPFLSCHCHGFSMDKILSALGPGFLLVPTAQSSVHQLSLRPQGGASPLNSMHHLSNPAPLSLSEQSFLNEYLIISLPSWKPFNGCL